jgi:hypothetical protein
MPRRIYITTPHAHLERSDQRTHATFALRIFVIVGGDSNILHRRPYRRLGSHHEQRGWTRKSLGIKREQRRALSARRATRDIVQRARVVQCIKARERREGYVELGHLSAGICGDDAVCVTREGESTTCVGVDRAAEEGEDV